jgi:hypothetical protein
MNKSTPTWYKLIEHWCRQRIPKGYGLTLPFIIGVTNNPNISHLLTEIKDSEQDENIILQWCGDLNEYVLSLDDNAHPIAEHLSGEKALLYNDDKIESFKSFDEITSFLEGKYSQRIQDKTFSKNKRTDKWEAYTPADNEFINKVTSADT